MTSRTWVGGSDNNAASSAANWSPTGAPKPGDDLTIVTGTMDIGGRLKGDTLHIVDPKYDIGPVTLNLLGGANVNIDGQLQAQDPLLINVTGTNHLHAVGAGWAGGANPDGAVISLAANAHLFVTGTMQFGYGGMISGGQGSVLTNNGFIDVGSSNSAPGRDGIVSAVAINGSGTLFFRGYHDQHGIAVINAPIAASQTVELSPQFYGLTTTLVDPSDFHALLKIDPGRYPDVGTSLILDGVHADGFTIHGKNQVMLTNGGVPVDTLRVANAGSFQITATDGTAGTTMTFVAPPPTA